MSNKLDSLDRRIIHLLQEDGRATSADIARQLGVAARTVRNRIDRMIERGAVFPTLVVNHSFFGYQTAVDIFCEVEIDKIEQAGAAIAQLPEVNYIAYSTGDQDISIQALLPSSDDVYSFIRKLADIPGVRRTRTVLVPRILKNTYEWMPAEGDFDPYEGERHPG